MVPKQQVRASTAKQIPFLLIAKKPPRARREMTEEVEFRRSEAGRATEAIAQIRLAAGDRDARGEVTRG